MDEKNNNVVSLIVGMIKDLKNDVNSRFDKIESKIDNLVTKEECRNNTSCKIIPGESVELLEKKEEWTVKKITAMTGLIVAAIGGIAGIVKLVIDGI